MGLINLKQVSGGTELQALADRVASGDIVDRRLLEVYVADAVGTELSAVLTASGGGHGTWTVTEYVPFASSSTVVEEYDDAELMALKADVEGLIAAFAAANSSVLGVRLRTPGLRYGAWTTVDGEGNNLNGDAVEADESTLTAAALGVELTSPGDQFGTWTRLEVAAGVTGDTSAKKFIAFDEEVVALKAELAEYKFLMADMLSQVHGLANPTELGVRQLLSGLRYGWWLTVDGEGNNLNGDAVEEAQSVRTVLGVSLVDASVQYGDWIRYANVSDAMVELTG